MSIRSSFYSVCLLAVVAIGFSLGGSFQASAQSPQGQPAVYQPYSTGGNGHDEWRRDGRDFRRGSRFDSQQVQIQAGWFQRPYPYHLDYYKMRFSGPPYAGNLYGTPGVNYPPYYGPYYTGYGQPVEGGVSAVYSGVVTPGVEINGSSSGAVSTEQAKTTDPKSKATSETLPAPPRQ